MKGFVFVLVAFAGFLVFAVDGQHEAALRQQVKEADSSAAATGRETIRQSRQNASGAVPRSNLQLPQTQTQQVGNVQDDALSSSVASHSMQSSVDQLSASSLSQTSTPANNGSNLGSQLVKSKGVSSLQSPSALTQPQDQVGHPKSIGGLRGTEQQIQQFDNLITLKESSGGLVSPNSLEGEVASMSLAAALPTVSQPELSSDLAGSQSSMVTAMTTTKSEGAKHSGESRYHASGENAFATSERAAVTEETNQQAEVSSLQSSSGQVVYPEHVRGYATVATSLQKVPMSLSTESVSKLTKPTAPKHGRFHVEEDAAECKPLHPQEIPVSATWLSSYPGSGSKLAWRLIESVTGLSTGDDLDSNGQVANGVAVAVKTHFPSHSTEKVFTQSQLRSISRTILVLRNPMHAIPAFFRHVYFVEQKHERSNYLEQPPTDAWVAWLSDNFNSELKLWVEHVRWWMAYSKRENLHLLPYEYLSSPERGSDELQKVGNFLASADQVVASHLLEPEKFCCVWEKMVDRAAIATSRTRKNPLYTEIQLEALIQALVKMRDDNKTFHQFFVLMQEYLGDIVEEKKAVEAMATKQA